MPSIISAQGLCKQYGEKTAVDNLSFEVEKHSLFAFLGQNGAGKTTTIHMLIGLLERSGGKILYNGSADLAAFKNKIGVVFQNNILDDLLTLEENLLTHAALYIPGPRQQRERLQEVAKLLALNGFLKQRFHTLSGGQKRKAEIARALFQSPEILFLDEPTTGLDPKTREDVWKILYTIKKETDMTIFLTTHYLEETASADQTVIIDKGRLVASGSPAELKAQYTCDRLLLTPHDASALEKQLQILDLDWSKTADTYRINIASTAQSIDLLHGLKENIRFYEVLRGSMDDVFLTVVGEKSQESEET